MALELLQPLSITDYDGNWREDKAGNIVIRSKVGAAVPRNNYERKVLPAPQEAGLPGWERAHSQGPGTGLESAMGIYYAPRNVNQRLQNNGVEDKLRQLQKMVAADNASESMRQRGERIILVQTTAAASHKVYNNGKLEDTNRLREIDYHVQSYSERLKRFRILFEVWIEVSNSVKAPLITVGGATEVSLRWNDPEWIYFLDIK